MKRLLALALLIASPVLAAEPTPAQQQQAAIDAVTARITRDVASLSTALQQSTAQLEQAQAQLQAKATPPAPPPDAPKP